MKMRRKNKKTIQRGFTPLEIINSNAVCNNNPQKRQSKTIKHKRKSLTGFTFLEVMVVVAILAILATLIIPRLAGRVDDAKKTKAVLQMKSIMQALELYKLDNGFYPSTDQGLQALVERPVSEPVPQRWKKYMDKIPKDPWKHEFVYVCPGVRSAIKDRDINAPNQEFGGENPMGLNNTYDLMCLGPNGAEGDKDDILSWDMPEE